jgi:cobalamin biosynthesis Mg chelatase CobN
MHDLSRLLRCLLGVALLGAASLLSSAPALAAGCSRQVADQIVNQAYKGSVSAHHTQACYRRALGSLDKDTSGYTDVPQVIQAAMLRDARADARKARGAKPSATRSTPTGTWSTAPRTGTRSGGGAASSTGRHARKQRHRTTSTSTAGGVDTGTTTELHRLLQRAPRGGDSGVPLPVIVLGVLAAALVLGGLAGLVIRRRLSGRDPGSPPLL